MDSRNGDLGVLEDFHEGGFEELGDVLLGDGPCSLTNTHFLTPSCFDLFNTDSTCKIITNGIEANSNDSSTFMSNYYPNPTLDARFY
jgi:hypothetical protein